MCRTQRGCCSLTAPWFLQKSVLLGLVCFGLTFKKSKKWLKQWDLQYCHWWFPMYIILPLHCITRVPISLPKVPIIPLPASLQVPICNYVDQPLGQGPAWTAFSPWSLRNVSLGCGTSCHHLYGFQTAMILSLSNVPGGFSENRKLPNPPIKWSLQRPLGKGQTKYSKWSTIQSISWAECLSRLKLDFQTENLCVFPADCGWVEEGSGLAPRGTEMLTDTRGQDWQNRTGLELAENKIIQHYV